eukprot:Blabericola_migrator_1__7147@NODE_361_length_9428_cov_170_189510_g289_i0_p1_GENE_NODE_361_length_9428_cov_170_189510_g289_i0NODE_361_length_9428_cov_170_189510_g289_i0_p1_ORF_typecomplete_len2151_score258_16PPDK_N/PF01326_19/7_7e06_NODE_361_length_9428_cov_170_189510_g289_i04086860
MHTAMRPSRENSRGGPAPSSRPYLSSNVARQKTFQFHFFDPVSESKRFVAVTVSQRRDDRDRLENAPMLPPSYYVWIELSTNLSDEQLYLHWGVTPDDDIEAWQIPPVLPPGSFIWQGSAIRTPLVKRHNRMAATAINLGQPHQSPALFQFVLYLPQKNLWVNPADNHNFLIPVKGIVAELQLQAVREHLLKGSDDGVESPAAVHDVAVFCPTIPDVHHIYHLPSKGAELDVAIWTTDEAVIIDIITNIRPALILHWGFLSPIIPTFTQLNTTISITQQGDSFNEPWERPDPRLRPPDAVKHCNDPGAVETYFQRGLQGPESSIIQSVRLVFPYDVIFERCLTDVAASDDDTKWYLPVLRDSYLSASCGAFPQRLAFVLRSREEAEEWIHNECGTQSNDCRFEVCPLEEGPQTPEPPKQSGKVIHHSKFESSTQGYPKVARNFEVSIPFSEAFKQRLYQEIQRASAQADISQRFRHAEFCSDNGDALSQPPSACLRDPGIERVGGTKKVIQPYLSMSPRSEKSDWGPLSADHTHATIRVSASISPPVHPVGLHALIAPPPLPGTVIYHHSYTLDDPSGKGVAHVLAIEDTSQRHEWQGEVLSIIKVHIMVSISVPCIIHWGILTEKKVNQWTRPERSLWPEGTEAYDAFSVDSPMKTDPRTRMCRLELYLPQGSGRGTGIGFVLRDVITDRWIKDVSGKDLYVRTRRDRIPELWARRWRGPHANLIATLLQEELRLDAPTHASQRYLALQRSITLYGVDRSDVEYWTWIYVWWRFAHLRIFNWQKHAHSRPWEIADLADNVSLNITSSWRSATRSRPIIKLLMRHVYCPGPEDDLRRELHSILSGWNLLSLPFYDQWYRKIYRSVGVDDYVVCRGLISMLQTLNLAGYHEVLKFHCCAPVGLETPPVIPPCFAFLQSQVSHIASTRAKQEDSPVSGDGDSASLTSKNKSTDFIGRHIELQTSRLRLLVEALEDFSFKLQALFFGPTIETSLVCTRDSITVNLKSVMKEIRDLRRSLRPACPRIYSSLRQNRRTLLRELAGHSKLLALASKGRVLTAPVLMHCTDNRIVRDFIVIDHSLDAVQQEALSRLFAYSGPSIRMYDGLFNANPVHCSTCKAKHQNWNDPLALMLPWLRCSDRSLIFSCPQYTLGCVVKLALIVGWLLPGLKILHSSSEEANVLLNDWASLTAHITNSSNPYQSIDPAALVEGLLNGDVDSDFLYLLAAFLNRVERCSSRLLSLSLVYMSDKVKFLFDCLDDSEMYNFATDTETLESHPYPPAFPRPFNGSPPFMELLPFNNTVRSHRDLGSKQIPKDVNSFLKGIIQHSELFWIAVVLNQLNPILRTLTYVTPWRPLSDARHASGYIVMVDSMTDLRAPDPVEAFYKPVVLLVRHATGMESVPYNTAGIITGPMNVEKKGQYLPVSPHFLSPLALQTRQLSILSITCVDESDFDAFMETVKMADLGPGDLAEFILPETFTQVVVHPLGDTLSPTNIDEKFSDTGYSLASSETACTSTASSGPYSGPFNDPGTADAALVKHVLACLETPRKVTPYLPPQTGPLLPTLHCFCSSTCSSSLRVLPEDALSAEDSFSTDSPYMRHLGDLCWGSWFLSAQKQRFPLLRALPVMSITLFEKLYGTSRWFLSPREFTPLVVGARGVGIQMLRKMFDVKDPHGGTCTRDITVPTIAVPFGAFPSTLRDPENHALAEKLHSLLLSLQQLNDCLFNPSAGDVAGELYRGLPRDESVGSIGSMSGGRSVVSSTSGSDVRTGSMARVMETRRCERILRECRSVVRSLKPSRECLNAMIDLVENEFPDDPDKRAIGSAIKDDKMKLWVAIKKVWCSAFTPGVLLATRVTKMPMDIVNFAVIIQLMEPVSYSFSLSPEKPSYISFQSEEVLKTQFPPPSSPCVYGEVTSGLPMLKGELYSGGHVIAGSPLTFRHMPSENRSEVLCFSSQSYVLKPRKRGLVLRPDQNIPGIGKVMPSAGLVCACIDTPTRSRFEYQKEPVFTDSWWRNTLLNKLGAICTEIRDRTSQDKIILALEGVVDLMSASGCNDPFRRSSCCEDKIAPIRMGGGASPGVGPAQYFSFSSEFEDCSEETPCNNVVLEEATASPFSIPTSHLRIKTVALESATSADSSYDTCRHHKITLTSAFVIKE